MLEGSNNVYVYLTDNVFSNNYVMNKGCIYAKKVYIEDSGSVYKGNSALYGSALYIESGEANILNVEYTGNYARYGGAIYVYDKAALNFNNCTFRNNFALLYGGAIAVMSSSSISGSNLYINFTSSYFYDSYSGNLGGTFYLDNLALDVNI